MSHLQPDLYEIFNYAFKMLRMSTTPSEKIHISKEVIKFLELLRDQQVEPKLAPHSFTRDFFAWLGVHIFSMMIDEEIGVTREDVVETFLQSLERHCHHDPLILNNLLRNLMESLHRCLDRNENYHARAKDPFFYMKYFNIGDVQPEYDKTWKSKVIDAEKGIQPAFSLFVLIVERCEKFIKCLDQTFRFDILDVILKMDQISESILEEKVVFVIFQCLLSVYPANCYEWDVVKSCLHAIRDKINPNFVRENSGFLIRTLTHLYLNFSSNFTLEGKFSVSYLMFILSLEAPFVIKQLNVDEDVSEFISVSIKLLDFLDLSKFNVDPVFPQIVGPIYHEFVPVFEKYVWRVLEAENFPHEPKSLPVYVEQKSPVWKLCMNQLDRVSSMTYSSGNFEKMLLFAAQVVSAGQRLKYLLNLKFPNMRFVLLNPRCLRSLSAVPYMCHECLSDFDLKKHEALALYVKVMLNLFAECQVSKLDDSFLVEHLFVILTLPWSQRYSFLDIPVTSQLTCLDCLTNLLFVLSPEKFNKYVPILLTKIHGKIPNNRLVTSRFFNLLLLLLFKVSNDIVGELTSIVKSYLMPENIELLFDEFSSKLLCFLSNSCTVRRTHESWELVCVECDALSVEDERPTFELTHFKDYVSLKFVEFLQNASEIGLNFAKCYVKFSRHSEVFRTSEVVEVVLNRILREPLKPPMLSEVMHRLSYNSNGQINTNNVKIVYKVLCSSLKNLSDKKLTSVMDVSKELFKVPYPCMMSVVRVLMIYYPMGNVSISGLKVFFNLALASRQLDLSSFTKQCEPDIAKFFIVYISYNLKLEKETVQSAFVKMARVFGYKIDGSFGSSTLMSSLIAQFIQHCEPLISVHVVSELASLFQLEPKTFVQKHYETVFAEIYSLDDQKVASNNFIKFFDILGIDLTSSVNWTYSELVSKSILNAKRPLKIIRFVFQPNEYRGVNNLQHIIDELKQHFVGCLTVIESSLSASPPTCPLHVAKRYIRCITNFIKILGSQVVTGILVKLLTALRTCLPNYYTVLPKHCLSAWVHFCFSVDVKKVGPYLPTILLDILPLLNVFPDVISNIFYYFVVENGAHFRDQIPQLYFVPCHSNVKMQQVWCVIQSFLVSRSNNLHHVVSILDNIYCESTETKIVALERLRVCLKDFSGVLVQSYRTEDELNPLFETILTCILDNITHTNNEVKTLCGACLGELGAVDPMKFGVSDAHNSFSPHKYNLMSDDFSVVCISKIVHCLGKYDDSYTTGVLYSTIQELLRLQVVNKTELEKCQYFGKFNTQDQYILQPLLQTKYIFKTIKTDRNSNPISFGYHTTKTPCEWASIWGSLMLARMPSCFQKNVFTTCLPAMRIDIEVMETVLPYILLYALIFCDASDVDLIEKEMKYILQWDLSKHRTKPDVVMSIVGASVRSVVHSDVSQTKYVAIILDLLDFLNQTVSDLYFFSATVGVANEKQLEGKIKNFVDRFKPCAMSWKSFVQNDHCRSLYYMEKWSADAELLHNLKPLRNIYTKLNDIDGLVGVAKSSTSAPTTEEIMVNHLVYGAVQDALSGYERLCSKYQSTNTYRGLIQSYININQASTALAISSQIIEGDKYLRPDIFSEHIEALWNSSKYPEIDDIFQELDVDVLNGYSWNIDLVGVFSLLSKPSYSNVLDKIKSIRLGLVNNLCDLNKNGMNLYRQGYWYIVKLHILSDIEYFSNVLYTLPPKGSYTRGFAEDWAHLDRRLELLPSMGSFIRDVRNTHLQTMDIVFKSAKDKLPQKELHILKSHLGMMWLDSAKKARKRKCWQDAYTCINNARKYEPPKLFIELAKYHQAKFDTDTAVLVLQQGLNENSNLLSAPVNSEERKIYANAKYLTASFNVGSMNLDFNDGYSAFKEAAEICNLEKSFVCLATYLYRQHLSEDDPDNTVAKRFIQLDAARNFSKSLLYGTKHIYQSMPCMLSLWLDYGARIAIKVASSKRADETGMTKTLKDFNSLMENNLVCLPTYMFMTAFSQILSRINHRQPSCFELLKLIICQIVNDHHQQAMWSFVSVCRSNNAMQRRRTEDICKRIQSSSTSLSRFFRIFNQFSDKLVDIALKKVKYSKILSLSSLNPDLKTLIVTYRNVPIMLPLQKFLTVHISNCRSGDVNKQHVPFPLAPVYINDVKDSVLMLFSVQMPKRLEFVGSDGVTYPLMCKKDDLRLDSRIMEFNSVINLLLRMDPIAKEKNLSVRTYSVVPLNTECGIIEWLTGLLSLKSIITDMYTKLKIPPMPMAQIKKLMLVQKDEVEMSERLRRFVDVILPKHPPVLHKWFFEKHPGPDAWYHCRNSFVKSAAVMSIVGYIVGLGDRHGENILIDSTTGEAVHVDFNCLFNRADFLTFPETVPFRLTHSMVRAMGPTGVEGLYVSSCEITNRVMRHNANQLTSVMKPFLYDIDVKPYNSRKTAQKDSTLDDQANHEAKINIQNIEMRLNGVVRCKNDQFAPHRNSKPLSVEGQTRMLIKEASSNLNLCQMFAGWAPYL